MNPMIVVVLDRARARFFDVGAKGTVELPCLFSPSTRGGKFHSDRHSAPGRGERQYHTMLREEERRHLAGVVARLSAVSRVPTLDVVLAGLPSMTSALRDVLPAAVATHVIGVTRIDPRRVTPARVGVIARRLQESWTQLLPL